MATTRIAFTPAQAIDWLAAPPMLRDVLLFLARRWPVPLLIVTSFYRRGDPGVHGQHRGIDVRISGERDGSLSDVAASAQALADALAATVNMAFDYDPQRPYRYQVAVSKLHGSGPHIHLQVHPNTVRRDDVQTA